MSGWATSKLFIPPKSCTLSSERDRISGATDLAFSLTFSFSFSLAGLLLDLDLGVFFGDTIVVLVDDPEETEERESVVEEDKANAASSDG